MIVKFQFTESMKYEDYKVTQRSDGRCSCRIPVGYETNTDGKKTYHYKTIYGVDAMDVKIKRAEFIDSQIHASAQVQLVSEMLITKLNEWLYVHKHKKVKPNSFDRLENTLEYQIIPALEHLGITDIRLHDVDKLHIERIMDYNLNRGYSYSTLLKVYRFLVSFFTYYEDELQKNPMRKYQFFRKESVLEAQANMREQKELVLSKMAKKKEEEATNGASKIHISEDEQHLVRMKLSSQQDETDIHYLTKEEIEKIKAAIKNGYRIPFKSRSGNEVMSALYMPKQGEFFLFMLYTGLRCGEAVALKYRDVNFENCTINVCRNQTNAKNRDAHGKATGTRNRKDATPKTKSSKRLISVSPYAIEVLRSLHANERPDYDGYILHNDTFEPISSKTLWQRFNKLLKGAGVECCGVHSLRHTCATLLYVESGGDAKFVCEQLRQKDPSFTTRTYIHQTEQKRSEFLDNFKI